MTQTIRVVYQYGIKKNCVEYILCWALSFLLANYEIETYQPGQVISSSGFVLSYGLEPPLVQDAPHLHIASAGLFFPEHYLNPKFTAEAPCWQEGIPLAFPSQNNALNLVLSENARKLIVPDILASAFFLLSRYEEFMYTGALDSRSRFTASMSWMGRFGLLHRALVDEYQLVLQNWIKRLAPDLVFLLPEWQGKSFAVALTRDIDSLCKAEHPSLLGLARSIKHGKFTTGVRKLINGAAVHYLHQPDPHNNLEKLIEWEREKGIRSSIYFMSSDVVGDANYRLKEILKKSPFLYRAKQEGWEFGFHPGFRTFQDSVTFTSEYLEAQSCLGPIQGGRQHTLRFKAPETWRLWENAGLQYESTLGFADHEGFRCGTCFPYVPFDLAEDRKINLLEVPLTAMDNTFTKYRFLDARQTRESMLQLLETVKQHRGLFVLLWHNTYFGRENVGDYHDVLASFVEEALYAGAQVGSLRDILSGWIDSRGL